MTMTVAIVQELIPEYRAPFFEALIRELAAQNVELLIYAGRPSRKMAARGDSTTPAWLQHISQAQIQVGGRRLTFRALPRAVLTADLVIIEQARRNVDAYALALVKPDRLALWGHGRDFVQSSGRVAGRALEWLTRRAAHIFVYTAGGADALVTQGISAERITTVMNSKEHPDPNSASQPAAHRHRLIFIGGIDDSKRLSFLIEAFRLAREELPRLELHIVGAGPDLPELIRRTRAQPGIVFHGRATGPQLTSLVSNARLIANPGRVGLVAIDSFHYQRPIFTTANEYHAPEFEYLTNDVNSIITADDISIYATALVQGVLDDRLWDRLRDGCRHSAAKYSLGNMVDRYAAGVMNLLNRPVATFTEPPTDK